MPVEEQIHECVTYEQVQQIFSQYFFTREEKEKFIQEYKKENEKNLLESEKVIEDNISSSEIIISKLDEISLNTQYANNQDYAFIVVLGTISIIMLLYKFIKIFY